MSKTLDSSDLVLVAFMPNPQDMEIARVLGWYRIRLKSSPKVVAVDWLAFYQPAAFGKDHKWRIETIAPVQGHEMMPRIDLLKDEPDHPRSLEEYYKIQVGPLQQLPRPVMAGKWKRVTFLYTTGERLLTAKTINDLTVKDAERTILWRALRERAAKYQAIETSELPEFPIPMEVLAMFMLKTSGLPDFRWMDEEEDDD